MRIIKGNTFAHVYSESLRQLLNDAEYETSPRGLKIKEITNMTMVIEDPVQCLYKNNIRSSQLKYICAEIIYYFAGRSDLEFIEKYAPFWRQIANEDGTINSAYGNLLFTQKNIHGYSQWQWAMQSLIKDKDSRQALMLFNKPQYQYSSNKDFICTLSGMFNIRNNKLNFTINMRSNDCMKGTPTDIAFFCLLQQQALKLLKQYYPELEMGTYTHIANSYHLYENDFDKTKQMLEQPFASNRFDDIGLNFIDIDGFRSDDLHDLIYSIENSTLFETNDAFFHTIKTKLS